MALFWFLAGMLTAAAAFVVILPWLRTIPGLQALPAVPWPVPIVAIVAVVAVLALFHRWGRPELSGQPAAPTAAPVGVESVRGAAVGPDGKSGAAASSMSSAIASLEARLAKGRGTPDDWELLAKSYEFVGRPEDAARAREHRFPPPSNEAVPSGEMPSIPFGAAQSGTAIVGEVSLAEALRSKAIAGETLFIVAKSIDAPGAPLAVFRSSVGDWPVKFKLDDSQSMVPGRNLSSAARVKIEARISASGQALPATGDLKGSSAVIAPTEGKPLSIVIDEVVR